MTASSEPGIVANVGTTADANEVPRTFLDPSADGLANRLANGVAKGHTVAATAITIVACFVVVGVIEIDLGLLITHVFEHGSIGVWDHHVSQWFDRHRTTSWNRITGDVTDLADTFEVAGVAAVVTIALLIRRWGRHGYFLVAGLAIELSIFLTANTIVKRHRPPVSHLGGTPSTYSFPSGHTAATLVLYGGIAILVAVATKRRWPGVVMWILAIILTISVALSRVYRGEHYPTDVLAGLLLGIGSLGAAVLIIRVVGVHHFDAYEGSKRQLSVASQSDEASK